MKYCVKCVTPETRPRVEFNKDGVCNACQWAEKKKTIDWQERWKALQALCDKYRKKDSWDVIVPCSGGKDGSTVAWKLKHDLDMHPLCVTFKPQMQTWLGRQNLENFIASGFDHIMISPDPQKYRAYAKESFIKMGMPKQPFVTGISTALLDVAIKFGIPFLMYGEQGEVEYGGKQETEVLHKFTKDFLLSIYYEGEDPTKYGWWWRVPDEKAIDSLYPTWWSLYEPWDPQDHAIFAKQHTGLQMLVGGNIGTFTNHAQLDDMLQDLHAYMMFVKFGFGRCTSDASIEIRQGRLSRQEGVRIVNQIDGLFPVEYLDAYLDYFDMTRTEFWDVIDSFANTNVLVKTSLEERPYVLRTPCV